MGAEAIAAIVGAAVGGGIVFFTQLGIAIFGGYRARRAAAMLIFAELVSDYAEAETAAKTGEWTSASGQPATTAWETYGIRLLPHRDISRVAHIASAYMRLRD